MIRAYERQNNPLYASPRDYRINLLAQSHDELVRANWRAKWVIYSTLLACFGLALLAIPTLMRLV